MATARLRKAFRYPTESDSDGPTEGIDEEEQDEIIHKLNTQDTTQNALYTKAFLALTLLPLPWYLISLFDDSTTRDLLVTQLGISSLLSTAYILYFIPPQKPDLKGKRPVYVVEKEEASAPTRKYIVWLAAALCGALAVKAFTNSRKFRQNDDWITDPRVWRCLLPIGIFGLVMFARSQMMSVDTTELRRARYPYKGA